MNVRDTSAQDVIVDPDGGTRRRRFLVMLGGGAAVLILVFGLVIKSWLAAKVVVPRARVRIATVTRGAFVRDVAADGLVVVANSPTLFSSAIGTVTFDVVAGAPVMPKQVLGTVDSPALNNELARERASLEGLKETLERQAIETHRQILESKQTVDLATTQVRATQRELERMKSGIEQGVVAQRDYDKAQDARDDAKLTFDHALSNARLQEDSLNVDLKNKRTDVERQKLLVADLERRSDALTLRSPVKGMVGSLLVSQKAAVAENQGLLTVVDLSALEVEFSISEAYASDLAIGMAADINYAGRNYRGSVTAISPEVQQNEVKGRVRFANQVPPGVRQNQRVSVRIVLDQRNNVLKVERGGFVDAGSVAYRVQGDVATRQAVKLGPMSVGEVQILSGLNAGDQIIVSSVSDLGDAPEVHLAD
ncbi:MAG: efflux RND transporter periplasmic adaptor subunit [Proteobacteria bacterium]|nr:efflux RND transporter periplasmic adaptor subunit [Pseudomonadota bacterium]